MSSNQKSTSNKPLFFFQGFFEKKTFQTYERHFYENEINPSMKSYKEEGYVEFMDCVYLNEKIVPRRIYFKDEVLNLIVLQKNISIRLIKDKVEEIENLGNSPHNFISKTKQNIISLSKVLVYNNELYDGINNILNEITIALEVLRNRRFENKKLNNKYDIQNGYFAPLINVNKLNKIYQIALEMNILDEDLVTEEDFVTVFTHPNPKLIENRIVFNSDNRKAFFFINNIKKYFDNLTPSRMSNSFSFLSRETQNKKSIILKQNNIDKINNDIKNIDTTKYNDILLAIKTMEEKYNF